MTSIKELDREQTGLERDSKSRGLYELLIEAVDQGNPPLTAEILAKV